MGKRWTYPEFEWPVDRGEEQYNEYAKQVIIARKIADYGMRFDAGRLRGHMQDARKRIGVFASIFQELTQLPDKAMGESGMGRTKAVKQWFKDAGAPDVVFDKKSKKPQFNMDALLCWATDYAAEEYAKPAAALYGLAGSSTNWRIANNYLRVLERPGTDGRIHLGYNVVGTKGTRWSSANEFVWKDAFSGEWVEVNLNAQNMPKKKLVYDFKGTIGKLAVKTSLRDVVIADPGCELISFDYEGAEARLIAYNFGDKELLHLVEADLDIHTATARHVWLELKIPADIRKIDKSMEIREEWVAALAPTCKALNLPADAASVRGLWLNAREACKGQLYGGAYQAPSKNGKDKYPVMFSAFKKVFPHINEEYFGELMKRFFKFYHGIRAGQLEMCDALERGEPTRLELNGRTLYFAPVARGKNQRLNFAQQSGIGFLITRAMPAIDAYLTWEPNNSAMLAMVHDELLLQARFEQTDELEKFVAAEMSKPATFGGITAGVPAAGDAGPDWAHLKAVAKRRKVAK